MAYAIPEITIALTIIFAHVLKKAIQPKWVYAAGAICSIAFLFLNLGLDNQQVIGSGLLETDSLGTIIKIVIIIAGLGAIFLFSSSGEVKEEKLAHTILYSGCILLVSLLLVSARDMIFMFVCIEVIAFAFSMIAGFSKSSEVEVKITIFSGISGALMLFGVALVAGILGSVTFYDIFMGLSEMNVELRGLVLVGLAFFIAGAAHKALIVPFHMLAMDMIEGMPAPSILLVSGAVPIATITILYRMLNSIFVEVMALNNLVVIAGVVTIIWGAAVSLEQNSIKRRLQALLTVHAGQMLIIFVFPSSKILLFIYSLFYVLALILAVLFISSLIRNYKTELFSELFNVWVQGSKTYFLVALIILGLLLPSTIIAHSFYYGFYKCSMLLIIAFMLSAFSYTKLITKVNRS